MDQTVGKISGFIFRITCRITGKDESSKKTTPCRSNDKSTCYSAVAESEQLIPTTHDSHVISIQTLDDNSSCSSSVLVQSKEEPVNTKTHDHYRSTVDNGNFSKANDDSVKVKEITTVTIPKPQVKKEGKWLVHYCSNHRILLVGEGDFSFSACLAKAFGSAANMVATSLDSLYFLEENYPSAESNIGYLRRRGCIVLHDMDATKMAMNIFVNEYTYDRIIFNFPLAGFFNESRRQHLRRNRKLVRSFMDNARSLLASDGEIHITHKSSATYKEWGLEELAKQCGLRLIEDVDFKLNHYPGYHNKYGFGGNGDFLCYPSRTYKFGGCKSPGPKFGDPVCPPNQFKKHKPQVKKVGKWLVHYCSNHRILLVGEGDFSFSACLAKAFGSAANMVATSLDSLYFLEENYPSAKSNIGYLKRRGCIVLHDMDATKMASNIFVNEYIYDRIIFNFPSAGIFNELWRQHLRRNRKLVRSFMDNARRLLASDGEIHITHKSSATYKEWGLEELAKQCRLRLIEDVEFKLKCYPGYHSKYGFGGNDDFDCYPSRTYKFGHK